MLRRASAGLFVFAIGCASDANPPPKHAPDAALDAGADAAQPVSRDAGLDAASPRMSPDAGMGGDASARADCKTFTMPADCTTPAGSRLPSDLRCTGLYGDWAKRELACGVMEYEPAHTLWSDGAEKHRFVSLPPGTTIDVTDPDGFVFPVGTQFWKEFRVDVGGQKQRAETRLLRKIAQGWLYTSYVWSADGATAVQTNDGVSDWNGTGHTVPTRDQCLECHGGRADKVLGWDFLMLGPGARGVTRESLAQDGLLVAEIPDGGASLRDQLALTIPGDDVERAALGYLHANCGVSCHNPASLAKARDTGFFMRLDADKLGSVLTTPTLATGLDRLPGPNAKLAQLTAPAGGFFDLHPLDLEGSLVLARMKVRGESQMPRLGTNVVDQAGVQIITAFIQRMTAARGYVSSDAGMP